MAEESLGVLEEVVDKQKAAINAGVRVEDLDTMMEQARTKSREAENAALGIDEDKPPTKREKEGMEVIKKLWEGHDLSVDDDATTYFRNVSAEDGGEGKGVAKMLSEGEVLLAVSTADAKEKMAKYFPDSSLNGWMPSERSAPKIEIIGSNALKATLEDNERAPFYRRELCSMKVMENLVGGDKLEVVVYRNPVRESDEETYWDAEPRRSLPGAGYSHELSGPDGKALLNYWNEKPLWIVAKKEWLS